METRAATAADDIDAAPYVTAIGPRQDYYLPRFRRFAGGRWISWNWAAFFATLVWLRYRKLYGWSWLYAFVSIPFLVWWLPSDRPEACVGADNEQAGVLLVALVAAVALMQAVVLVLALVALPDMKYYLLRAQISEGVAAVSAAAADVQRYQAQHGGRMPARLDDASKVSSSTYVSRLELAPDGAIRAIFNDNARVIAGRSVAMVPAGKPGEPTTTWRCVSDDLVDRCLPKQCKRR
jgi:hypothetical protein